MEQEQIERYFADFIACSKSHKNFDKAVELVKKLLTSQEGQEAFQVAFGTACYGNDILPQKDFQYKLSLFIPFLNKNNKKYFMGWLNPEYAKEYLHDEDPEIQEIVNRTLGINFDERENKMYEDYDKRNNKMFESLEKNNIPEIDNSINELERLKKRPPTKENRKKLDKLVKDLDVQFGKEPNKKLNSLDERRIKKFGQLKCGVISKLADIFISHIRKIDNASRLPTKLAEDHNSAGFLFFCPDDKTILLTLRGKSMNRPGTWDLQGGRYDDGDTSTLETASREATEELGTLPPGKQLMGKHVLPRSNKDKEYIIYIYKISAEKKKTWTPKIKLDHESEKYKWFPYDNLPKETHFDLSWVKKDIDKLNG